MTRQHRRRHGLAGIVAAGLALVLVLPGTTSDLQAADLQVVASVPQAPGNISVSAAGRVFISLHQLYQPAIAVAELVDGALVPFPNAAWNDPATASGDRFNAVLGLQVDADERLWLLDNAVGTDEAPRLIAWDLARDRLDRVIALPAPVTGPGSFLNDLAVDLDNNAVYITDTAFGPNPALVVVDLTTGAARRILEAAPSTAAEDIELAIEGKAVAFLQPDGTTFNPRFGADSIALDAANAWLYYGPLSGRTLYRIRTADLRNPGLDDAALSDRVERYAAKPVSDGIAVDTAGNVYITDFTNSAVGVIGARDRAYEVLYQDTERLAWPDGFSYGPDGRIYVTTTQLHRAPLLNGGENAVKPPFGIYAFTPLAPGVVGR